MGYAVLLYFDPQTEQIILNLRHALTEQGVASFLEKVGDRPHVSLAGFSDADRDVLISIVQEYANDIEPFHVQLSGIGTFPTDENVLFLSPTPTLQLLMHHQEFHRRLARSNLISSPYYVPEHWTPHCSVEMNIPAQQLLKSIDFYKKVFKPITGQFQEIGVVGFQPIQSLATWSLIK